VSLSDWVRAHPVAAVHWAQGRAQWPRVAPEPSDAADDRQSPAPSWAQGRAQWPRGTRALGRWRRPAEPSTLIGTPSSARSARIILDPALVQRAGWACLGQARLDTRSAFLGVCACGSQFSIMLKSRALHEHDRRLVGFRAAAIVIMFEKRCREVRVSKNFG
jgi:hypothetical protein